jgi:flagellar biosynthesis/type III secretory pathway chaperone
MEQPELAQETIDERVAILKRFRELLEEQRSKFREYLTVLEKQAVMIETENVDAMVRHTEIEQAIIAEIHTIQKVIDPLEVMYRDAHPGMSETEIPRLKTDLERLRKDVIEQNGKNRELLKSHMTVLRQQVASLRNPYAKRSSVYSSDSHTASRIDISQ